MKVAAFQAPLAATSSLDSALTALQDPVRRCESLGVSVLCCPEGLLGGLADHCSDPMRRALRRSFGDLERVASRIGSNGLTTILGFTEAGDDGRLYNSAAIIRDGSVVGLYRKRHPAIRRSVYSAGDSAVLFSVGSVAFGVLICRDSTFPEPVGSMIQNGARVIFIPTNNGLPTGRRESARVAESRECDISIARQHDVWVVRADVAGRTSELESRGSSGIVDPTGALVALATSGGAELLVAEIR